MSSNAHQQLPKAATGIQGLDAQPLRKVIGDLADTERALVGLPLRPSRP